MKDKKKDKIDFKYIEITLGTVKHPVTGELVDEFYSIYSNGLISFWGEELNRKYDMDEILKVIKILEKAIEVIKKYYKIEEV